MLNLIYKNLLPGRLILILLAFVLFYGCGAKRYGMEHVDPDTFESLREMGEYYDWWLKNLKKEKKEALKNAQEDLDKELSFKENVNENIIENVIEIVSIM